MTKQITLDEALKLVSFRQFGDGEWVVDAVAGNVYGHVHRSVLGDIGGRVGGNIGDYVGGSVCRSVHSTVGGGIVGDVDGIVNGNVYGCIGYKDINDVVDHCVRKFPSFGIEDVCEVYE